MGVHVVFAYKSEWQRARDSKTCAIGRFRGGNTMRYTPVVNAPSHEILGKQKGAPEENPRKHAGLRVPKKGESR